MSQRKTCKYFRAHSCEFNYVKISRRKEWELFLKKEHTFEVVDIYITQHFLQDNNFFPQ